MAEERQELIETRLYQLKQLCLEQSIDRLGGQWVSEMIGVCAMRRLEAILELEPIVLPGERPVQSTYQRPSRPTREYMIADLRDSGYKGKLRSLSTRKLYCLWRQRCDEAS